MHNNMNTPPHHHLNHHFNLKFDQQQLNQFHQHMNSSLVANSNNNNNINPATNNNNNNSSNTSTPNSNTSFFIKDILKCEGQKRKQRKARTAFSDHQLRELEASFLAKKYLTVQDRLELANKLKLSDTQVKTWYQNRRTKEKRTSTSGFDILTEANHMYAMQAVLQSQSNWLFSAGANPMGLPGSTANASFNLAAALLAAQASVQAGSMNVPQPHHQNLNINNMASPQQHQKQHQHQLQAASSLDNSAVDEPSISPASTSLGSPEEPGIKEH